MKLSITEGNEIDIREKETIYRALKRNSIFITASCGGKGTCGKCKVRIVEGSFTAETYGKLTQKERNSGYVLACKTHAKGDLSIEIPVESRLTVGDKIAISKSRDLFELFNSYKAPISPLVSRFRVRIPPPTIDDNISDLERLKRELENHGISLRFSKEFVSEMAVDLRRLNWDVNLCYQKDSGEALFLEDWEKHDQRYGIAVDIGTTTVVLYLIDLSDGRIVDIASTYNSQMRYGDDVITRIVNATEGGELNTIRRAVVTDINDLIEPFTRMDSIKPAQIESAIISGNTTMTHLFWGFNPSSIREEPYIPTANTFPVWKASDAGIKINPNAPVYTVPCVASYVGGDIVSGVLATRMHKNPEIALFMDIGTNGEIVVGNNEWLMTAACSAGPCFEGSGIKHGMRATEGAIESIRINRETLQPEIKVIGDGKPIGICGSAMIDVLPEMLLSGLIDQRGKLVSGSGAGRIRDGEDGLEFLIYSDNDREIVLKWGGFWLCLEFRRVFFLSRD